MVNGPIDEAYVEIKPDLSDFDRDVNRELGRSFDKIEDKLDDLTDTIERQFDRLIDALDANFATLEHIANNTFDEIHDAARSAGKSIARDIEVGTKIAKHEIDDLADNAHHDFNRIERDARGSGFSIGHMFSSLGKSIVSIFSNVSETVSNIGSKIGSSLGNTIGQIGSSIGTVTGGIGSIAQFALIATIIPVVIGLASALSQLVGILAALPAAAGVAAAAILPLVLAFHGFGEAIGAVLEGDPEKINEALKKLSPSAAKVVKEFSALVKPFGELSKLAQESLFKPLVGTLTQLANAVLPALRVGVPLVATAFGNMFASIGRVFANGETTGVIEKIFASTARIINNMAPILANLLDIVTTLFVTGLPYVERFFGVISAGVDTFARWLEKAVDGGKVTGWLDKAWDVGKKLWEVLKQLSIYAVTLFSSFADEGTDTLNGVGDALKKVNEYLKSDAGQETLHNLGVLIHWAGNAFVYFIANTDRAFRALNAFFDFIRGIGPFFSSIGDWIKNTWNSAVDWTVGAWHSIENFVKDTWNSIVGFFTSTGSNIGTWFTNTWDSMVNAVSNFVTRTIAAIQAFPGALKQWLADAVHATFYAIGYVIGLAIRWFVIDLPGAVTAGFEYLKQGAINTVNNMVNFFTTTIPNLVNNVGTWFWDLATRVATATQAAVTSAITWVSQLPGRVGAYISDLYGRVTGTISSMWHSAVSYFRNLVNDIVDAARRLPGQVWSGIGSLYDRAFEIGRDIVRGMVNGIKSLGSWLKDTAASLARDAYEGAKRAIGANSPSKEFAKLGRWSVEGFAQGFDGVDLTDHVMKSMKMPLNAFSRDSATTTQVTSPSVSVGGAQVVAYLQINDEQLHPVVVTAMHQNSQDVALANQQGVTQLARRR